MSQSKTGSSPPEITRVTEPKGFTANHDYPMHYPVSRIKYDGLFDFDGLYKAMYRWFEDYGYYHEEPSYKHKVPSPLGAYDEILWTGWRKTTPYIREWVKVYFLLVGAREVVVVKEGKRVKLTKARLLLEFNGHVETDFQTRWTQSQFSQYLKEFYDRYIVKKDIENIWWDRLYYRIYNLVTLAKKFLDMQYKENAHYDMW